MKETIVFKVTNRKYYQQDFLEGIQKYLIQKNAPIDVVLDIESLLAEMEYQCEDYFPEMLREGIDILEKFLGEGYSLTWGDDFRCSLIVKEL